MKYYLIAIIFFELIILGLMIYDYYDIPTAEQAIKMTSDNDVGSFSSQQSRDSGEFASILPYLLNSQLGK